MCRFGNVVHFITADLSHYEIRRTVGAWHFPRHDIGHNVLDRCRAHSAPPVPASIAAPRVLVFLIVDGDSSYQSGADIDRSNNVRSPWRFVTFETSHVTRGPIPRADAGLLEV